MYIYIYISIYIYKYIYLLVCFLRFCCRSSSSSKGLATTSSIAYGRTCPRCDHTQSINHVESINLFVVLCSIVLAFGLGERLPNFCT